MSAFLTFDGLCAKTPDGRTLFDNLTLSLGVERTGLVGRNGVGKTTLIGLALGEIAPAAGRIARRGRFGVLRQLREPGPEADLATFLGLAPALARLERIERGAGDETDFTEADWTLPARIGAAFDQVGLSGLDLSRPAGSLSGGEATRAALAAVLADAPDLLLLDEPTNNLDAAARAIVAEVLAGWSGGVLAVSHDRALLRGMDRIVELSPLGARVYGGGYDLYVERRTQENAAAERDLDQAAQAVARVERDIQAARERKARRDAAGRRFAARRSEPKILLGRQAERAERSGGREGRLAERLKAAAADDLRLADARVERHRTPDFALPSSSGRKSPRPVLAFDRVAFAYRGGPLVLSDLSFSLDAGERLAVVGGNGVGKSTLAQLAAGRLDPTAGVVARSGPAAMLDQQGEMLRPDESLVEAFQRLNPQASPNQARAALARFLFRNTAADRRIGELSGGERLRAALACAAMSPQPPGLLILDEPTNHLDLESIGALEAALGAYDGALLVVSHDPDFLDALAITRRVQLSPASPGQAPDEGR